MENENNKFHYVYSAKQQEEIQRIRSKYISVEEDKMEQLRKLDESVTTPGMIAGLIVGVVGTLLFGLALCCCLVWEMFDLGVLLGIVGMIGIVLAYPLYSIITSKQKTKLAPKILQLTEELMK